MNTRYRLRYEKEADAQLARIRSYIRDVLNDPAAASRIVRKIREAAKDLKIFPFAYPVIDTGDEKIIKEYRKRLVANFVIVYVADEDDKCIDITGVYHQSQNFEEMLR